MHHHQHHGGYRKVIKIGRDHKGDHRHHPQQLLALARPHHLLEEVEAPVIVQHLHDGHGSQKEQDNLRTTSHILQEDVPGDVFLDGNTRRIGTTQEVDIFAGMLTHHEVRAITDIEHPPHRTSKDGSCRFVDLRHATGCYQHITDE